MCYVFEPTENDAPPTLVLQGYVEDDAATKYRYTQGVPIHGFFVVTKHDALLLFSARQSCLSNTAQNDSKTAKETLVVR